ncbi:MAG: gamma-glutamyl-gamma-aminobutyrate hydrolase family protein [Anaerolineae bacterium]|nr:gamma-glutamyl-gamma-aminobutyrate hydrolase family protein [Anaerolineae bacterium]
MTQRRPIIGLTTYERDKEQNYGLPAEYIEAVRRAGGVPVLLPHGEPYQDDLLQLLDGVIFTGGGDIDPTLYQGTKHEAVEYVDAERDSSEIALIRLAVETGLPMLNICRGAQVLNVALGGTLIEHLPDEIGGDISHRTDPPGYTYHPVKVEAGSRLATIVEQTEVTSNSWHHQAVRQLAPGLKAVAFAPDGTIEAVEMPDHPWLVAVQWHPESMAAGDSIQQRIFDALVQAAAQRINKP